MPAEPVVILLLIAVGANLLLTAALVAPPLLSRRRAPEGWPRLLAVRDTAVTTDDDRTAAYDRVVGLVSWTAILGASAFVAVSGLWPLTQTAILVVLALGGFMLLLVHGGRAPGVRENDKVVLAGCVAITLVTLIVIVAGESVSPLFFAYPVIVGAAALVVAPAVTVVLAVLASIDYVIAVTFDRSVEFTAPLVPNVAINTIAILLLAFSMSYLAREQRRSLQAATRPATVDSLTGLSNRAFFIAAVEGEIQRSARTGRRFGLLMMDVDGLKAINDRFGHFYGDLALRSVAQVIRTGVRRIDTPARYGGDEFACLLPETEPMGTYLLAEKIRQGVEKLRLAGPAMEMHASISIGAVSFPDDGLTPDDLLTSADRATDVSKRQGKNRVVGYATTTGAAGPSDDAP